jgi:hypothetical protein
MSARFALITFGVAVTTVTDDNDATSQFEQALAAVSQHSGPWAWGCGE